MRRSHAILGALACCVVAACKTLYPARFASPDSPETLESKAPYLKCHMADGRVFVLEDWKIDTTARIVSGSGLLYDARRELKGRGPQSVPLDEIAMLETNRVETIDQGSIQIGVMAAGTVASLGFTAFCITTPKACFGSCPTFFTNDGSGVSLQAEGFSASIARAYEATDVDAMWTAKAAPGPFDVLMTNDALETHAIDSVRLLALARPKGGRVLRAGERYFEALAIDAPIAASGDSLRSLVATDGDELHSLASATDLAERETVELTFADPKGAAGVVIVARNSLLTTFLFYQELAYMGRRAGDWIAAMERQGVSLGGPIGALDNDIAVSVRDESGRWQKVGVHSEVGPIAKETQLVVLPPTSGEVHVRLEMTRGNWRIDQVGLARLGGEVRPTVLEPKVVLHRGAPDPTALAALRPRGDHLFTVPGDEYTLRFELPSGDSELFLESRGYYYEWTREAWFKDEDQVAAMRMLMFPDRSMKELASKFKALEPEMDRIFWESRYVRRSAYLP